MIQEIGFALDSPLERAGFEPSVPRALLLLQADGKRPLRLSSTPAVPPLDCPGSAAAGGLDFDNFEQRTAKPSAKRLHFSDAPAATNAAPGEDVVGLTEG